MIKSDWKIYVLKYIKEEVNYVAVTIGLFLMIFVSTSVNLPIETKVFIDISIFIISLNYKYLVQVFQEK